MLKRTGTLLLAALIIPGVCFAAKPKSAGGMDKAMKARQKKIIEAPYENNRLEYNLTLSKLNLGGAITPSSILGKAVEYGTSKEVFANPKTDYTKALMAAAFHMEATTLGGVKQ